MKCIEVFVEFSNIERLNKVLYFANTFEHNYISLNILFDKKLSLNIVAKLNKCIDKFSFKKQTVIRKSLLYSNQKLNKFIKNYCRNNDFYLINKIEYNYEQPETFSYSDFNNWKIGLKSEYSSFYQDYFNSIILERSLKKCYNNSCLGKTIYISKDGNVSFCPYNIQTTLLGNLNDFNDFKSAFDNEYFINILEKQMLKREKCIENCKIFNYCQGYCPFETKSICKLYVDSYKTMSLTAVDIIANGYSLNNFNKSIKNTILQSIALDKYNKIKEKNYE